MAQFIKSEYIKPRLIKQGLLISGGLLLSGIASAHTSVLQEQGFFAALLHYLSGLDHWLALFAVGLLVARLIQKQ